MTALDKIRQAKLLLEQAEAELTQIPEPEPEPDGAFFPDGIDATGDEDVTDPLRDWLDSLPEGSTADLGEGVYRCERPIRLDDKTGLTIRNGTLTRTDRTGHGGIVYPHPNPHIWLMRPTRCRIENVDVFGTNTRSDVASRPDLGTYKKDYEFEAAIRLEQFTDCQVIGGSADSVWGDGIQAQIGRGLLVEDYVVVRNGRQGISPLGSDFIIRRCSIKSRRAGIDMEPDTGQQAFGQALIEDCVIDSWLIPLASFGPGEFSDVEIRYNRIVRGGIPCVNADSSAGGKRDRWHVHHNVFGGDGWATSSPAPVMRFHNSADSIVENNLVWHHKPSGVKISVGAGDGTTNLVVRRNRFVDSGTVIAQETGGATWTEHDNVTTGNPDWFEPVGPR